MREREEILNPDPRVSLYCVCCVEERLRGWLHQYDPEAYEGMGNVILCDNRDSALIFANHGIAMQLCLTIPKRRPLRPDGKPNRPLTAFHMEFVKPNQASMLEKDTEPEEPVAALLKRPPQQRRENA